MDEWYGSEDSARWSPEPRLFGRWARWLAGRLVSEPTDEDMERIHRRIEREMREQLRNGED